MPKKQTTATVNASSAAPARAAKPRTPRVQTVKHSKTASIESASPVIAPPAAIAEDRHTAIAKIAYGYWEARGFQHGSAHEDWLRAEAEYRSRSTV